MDTTGATMAIGGLMLLPGVTVQECGCCLTGPLVLASPDMLTVASLPFEGTGQLLSNLLDFVLVVLLGGWAGGQALLFTAALLLNCSVLPGALNGVEALLTGSLRTLWKENAPLQIKKCKE